jgi:SAM-dependent methyltransferase
MMETTPDLIAQDRDAFIGKLFDAALGAFDIFAIYIGDRLGFYHELARNGGSTPAELAERTGTHPRYTREWLEQQATSCILETARRQDGEMTYLLPPGRAEVLTDRDSLNYLAPLAQLIAGSVSPLESLLEAYRSGGGVPFSDYGANLREGQANINRPMFLKQLGQEWLPAIPDVHARLQANPPARVADIGCGAGWSCIGLAQAYPKAQVDGYDLDEASVALARRNVTAAGLDEQVQIHLRDASDPELQGRYDLVMAYECLHDMSNPVGALRAMRLLAGGRGAVVIVDERALDDFTPCAEFLERYLYGFSILHCLPAGMAEHPSAGTGTVMRPDTLKRYAQLAGYRQAEVLPIDHFFFYFYRLWP